MPASLPTTVLFQEVRPGFHGPLRSRAQSAVLAFLVLLLDPIGNLAATFDLPFMAANHSGLDPDFANSPALTKNQRVLQFVVPSDFRVDSSSQNDYSPDGVFNGLSMGWPADRDTTLTRPVPGKPNATVTGSVLADSTVSVSVLSNEGKTLSEAVADSFLGLPPLGGPIVDVEVNFVIQGGAMAGRTMRLKGKMGSGLQTRASTRPTAGITDAQLTLALDWGRDIHGESQKVLIQFQGGAGVFTEDNTVLPLSEVASSLLGVPSTFAYVQGILGSYQSQLASQSLRLMGAVPELLVLYDYSVTHTVSPESTIAAAVFPDNNDSLKAYHRYINQYDSGTDDGLPSRYGKPGGNACGPTALRMALSTRGLRHTATTVYGNTMEKGLEVAEDETNAFHWNRAQDWLNGNTHTFPRFGPASGLPIGTRAYYLPGTNASQVAAAWARIDGLLTAQDHQPVLLRTDLTTGSGRGNGHVILLLGKGHSDTVRDAYGLSGEYYVVGDPAGHFFANDQGNHYGRITNLMSECVGINYGGWFGIYPFELLRDSIRNLATGSDVIKGLTLGVPFPVLRVDIRSPAAVVVTDPLGRKTGNKMSGEILGEIPDSWFAFASGDEEYGASFTDPDGIKTVLINNPVKGLYLVELTGTGNGSFVLDWGVFGGLETPIFKSIDATIFSGQQRSYTFTLGGGAPGLPTATLASLSGNAIGANPSAGLALSGSILYGTATQGGGAGNGTVFSVGTDGAPPTLLHGFSADVDGANSDGRNPYGGLFQDGDTLYGTTLAGGDSGNGTVFSIRVDGTGFKTLHEFSALPEGTNEDGANPFGGLILLGNTLYGTTFGGGPSGSGTVFAVNTNGTAFRSVHGFGATSEISPFTNSGGANPAAGLTRAGNTLYGTSYAGGPLGHGTVFAVNPDGTGFRIIHGFGDEGANPSAALLLADNILYGTAATGGNSARGTVFAVNVNGAGFETLHDFTGEGAYPSGGLILIGNTLYGTASGGGGSGNGTLFAMRTDGTGFATLHDFTAGSDSFPPANSDGANPSCTLVRSGNMLYGTAPAGGVSGVGTIFSLTLGEVVAPRLQISTAADQAILTWPIQAIGFALQSTTNLATPADWRAVLPVPSPVNGQNTVTTPLSGTPTYYRLSQ